MACRGWIAGAFFIATLGSTGAGRADVLTFQHGDGGGYSGTLGTTIGPEAAANFGVHFLLTIRTYYYQSLVCFPDIIGENPGQIPPGSTINSATLSVTMYDVRENSGDNSIHEVYVPWDENTVGLEFYAGAGTLYGPAVGTVPVTDPLEVTSGDMTAIVQHWADGAANHGIMLRTPDAEEDDRITRYYSDDAQTPSDRPKLTVDFTPPLVAVEQSTWGRVKALLPVGRLMEMKQYLIDTFNWNDKANRQILAKIRTLPSQEECNKYFSHLINSQNKWIKRIEVFPQDPKLDWWKPMYPPDQLEAEWEKSLKAWLDLIESKSEEDLFGYVKWVGFDGGTYTGALKDIALQLNYQSIHHRAQMQTIIRAQGVEPEFIDYIGTVYRKLE